MTHARARSVLLGGGAGLFVQLWLLTAGRFDVLARRPAADLFDAQAEAWLAGHWWLPRSVVGIEGIVVDGHTQMYFGPLPGLLRLPAAALGEFGGRLSVVSMLLAAALSTWAAVRLVRQLAPEAANWLAPTTAFLVPAGTTAAYLASLTLVYHEAAAWGIATALAAFSFIFDAAGRREWRSLALAVAATTACGLSRVSIALGPILALGLLAVLRTWRDRRAGPALGAPLVPVVAVAGVNLVRFGAPFSVPFQQQVQTMIDPNRPAFFAENGGFFNVDFIPTTLFHYLQPLGLRPSGWWPFVDFPPRGRVLGGATFDLVDRTASVPATMPALTLLAVVGAAVLVRRGTFGGRLILAGGLVAMTPALAFGYVAHRYLADFVPGLVVLAVAGADAVAPRFAGRRLAWGALAVLAGFGVWVNVGLGLLQQRVWAPGVTSETVRDFSLTRLAIDDRLHLARPTVHRARRTLPDRISAGEWVVLGSCDAVYLETGVPVGFLPKGHWRVVEQAGRELSLRLQLDPGTRGVIAEVADGERRSLLSIVGAGDGRGRLHWSGRPAPVLGPIFRNADPLEVTITADPNVDSLVVRVGGTDRLESLYLGDGGIVRRAGASLGSAPPTLCRKLLRSAHERGSVR